MSDILAYLPPSKRTELTMERLALMRAIAEANERIVPLEAVAAADLALIAELDAWLNDASSLRHDATPKLHAAEARFHEARRAAGLDARKGRTT